MSIPRTLGAAVAAGALLLGGAPAASAAAPVPFEIHELVDFTGNGENTFTATGPLCPSGTFVDDVHTFGGHPDTTGKFNLLIRTVYTCDDGSGDFHAQKHVFIAIGDDDTFTGEGPISLHGGTGAYTQLSGHGQDIGFPAVDGIGRGEITGVIVNQ